MTKAKAKLFHTIRRVAVKVEAGDKKGALRTLGFLALRLERFELHWAKGYKVPDEYPHQYTPDDCPGNPCGSCCDHRGVRPFEHLSVPERRALLLEDEVDDHGRTWEPHEPGRKAEGWTEDDEARLQDLLRIRRGA